MKIYKYSLNEKYDVKQTQLNYTQDIYDKDANNILIIYDMDAGHALWLEVRDLNIIRNSVLFSLQKYSKQEINDFQRTCINSKIKSLKMWVDDHEKELNIIRNNIEQLENKNIGDVS